MGGFFSWATEVKYDITNIVRFGMLICITMENGIKYILIWELCRARLESQPKP